MKPSTILLAAVSVAFPALAEKAHVVFVTGDHEYSGEQTLPILAKSLETQYGFRCTVLKASPNQNSEENIPGLEALAQADLAVFYLRWRRLPKEQLAHIDAYVKSGKPVFGYRTSSHPFNYPAGHVWKSGIAGVRKPSVRLRVGAATGTRTSGTNPAPTWPRFQPPRGIQSFKVWRSSFTRDHGFIACCPSGRRQMPNGF